MSIVITVLVVLAVLLANEWWWRGRAHGEVSRKFVHITVGTFVAFWPLFLTWRQIEILSLAFVAGVAVSQRLNVFKTIHSVQRPTWGEWFFGLSAGAVAITTHSPAIYAAALLHMSLADGVAAIVGVRLGANNAYHLLGQTKSAAGSLAFALVSALIVTGFALQQHTGFHPYYIAIVAGTTLLENIAVRGLDNLLVPLLVAWVLSRIV